MRIYIVSAEADKEVAEDFGNFLERQGCTVRIALGSDIHHPTLPGEMTIALWSLKTRMSPHQIMFTNRAIDALMDNNLIIAQLDFHPLPYGLTDVNAYDLRSPGMRKMRYNEMLAELRRAQRAQLAADRVQIALGPQSPDGSDQDVRNDEFKIDMFVSYAVANQDIVFSLVDDMQSTGANIWIDKEQLKSGVHWSGEIVRAIKSSHLFCVMCTAQSFASDNVRREIYLADKYDKPILPVLLDGALMPEDIEFFLINRQCLDMTRVDHTQRLNALRDALVA